MKYQPAVLLLFFSAMMLQVAGQDARSDQGPVAYQNTRLENSTATVSDPGSHAFRSNVSLNEINIRAYRHFFRNYPAGLNEYWYKSRDGYVVSFMTEVAREEVYYKLNGDYEYTARYFPCRDLDRDIRGLVMERFPGYQLDIAIAFTSGEQSFYLITIHDRETVKTVRYLDGKLDVVSDLENANK